MISVTLKKTIAKKVIASGQIAKLKDVDRRSFHSLDADKISEALRRIMRLMTAATPTSATPTVLSMVTVDVVLIADVVLMADVVLITDDNRLFPPGLLCSYSSYSSGSINTFRNTRPCDKIHLYPFPGRFGGGPAGLRSGCSCHAIYGRPEASKCSPIRLCTTRIYFI